MKLKLPKIRSSSIAAVTALFISGLALTVSIVQTSIMREQQYASARPIVHWSIMNGSLDQTDSTGSFEVTIFNQGLGIAFIHWVAVQYESRYFDGNDHSFLQQIGKLPAPPAITYSTVGYDQVMKPSENLVWITPKNPREAYQLLLNIWESDDDDIDVIICFSDIYGHYWKVNRNTRIVPCKDCRDLNPAKTKH